jgi:hypothetical protein
MQEGAPPIPPAPPAAPVPPIPPAPLADEAVDAWLDTPPAPFVALVLEDEATLEAPTKSLPPAPVLVPDSRGASKLGS